MKSILNLNHWTKYLLIFAPIIILMILSQIKFFNELDFGVRFAVSSLLFIVNVTFLYFIQFYLGNTFYKAIGKRSFFFIINGSIPLLGFLFASLWTIYHIPMYFKMMPNLTLLDGPKGKNNPIIYIMIYQYILTYFFINIILIRYQIRKIQDTTQALNLKSKFLTPMKRIAGISGLLIFVALIGLFINFIKIRETQRPQNTMPKDNKTVTMLIVRNDINSRLN